MLKACAKVRQNFVCAIELVEKNKKKSFDKNREIGTPRFVIS